jgi:hypothetical protein
MKIPINKAPTGTTVKERINLVATDGVSLFSTDLSLYDYTNKVVMEDSSRSIIGGTGAGSGSTGVGKVILGYSAGANSTGSENIILGYESAPDLTTGNANVLIGEVRDVSTGSYNIVINSPGTVTSSAGANVNQKNVIIGYQAGPSTAKTINQELYINDTQSDSPLIHGDFAADTLKINGDLTVTGDLHLPGLPTSDPTTVGQVWNNAGVLTVSAG